MSTPSNPSAATGLIKKSKNPLRVEYCVSSVQGLESITSLIIGDEACVVVDPPFLIPDAEAVVKMIKEKSNVPLVAVFVTHHHPDHYFSAKPILDAYPEASFFAAPYVLAGIEREYDEKVVYWPSLYGDLVPKNPPKPKAYPFSFFILPGNANSPLVLLGPVQGDSVDHSLIWLPREKTLITGDCCYASGVHVWAEEIETAHILESWRNILDLIDCLELDVIIPGHAKSGQQLDAAEILQHNRKYLDLFANKITYAKEQPTVDDIKETFIGAFPEAKNNHDFFIGMLAGHYGAGGKKWEENAHHQIDKRRVSEQERYVGGNDARLKKDGKA